MLKYSLISLILTFGCAGYSQMKTVEIKPIEYTYDSIGDVDLKAYVFSPENRTDFKSPAIVIFHGGGWEIGEASWAFGRAQHFASLGFVAVAAQYRLSDRKNVTPVDAMRDARAIITWMRQNAKILDIDPERLVAYGWSAGAHLAVSAAVFNEPLSAPNALALVSPAVSLGIYEEWFNALLLHKTKTEDVSPDMHIRPGLPPTIIVQGRNDSVTPLFAVNKFVNGMKAAGNQCEIVVYENVGHLFTPSTEPDDGYPNPDKVVQAKAYAEIDSFLRRLGYIH